MKHANNMTIAPLKQFFGRLTERSFADLFIRDRTIADYVADMLARFARTDRLYRIKNATGQRLETVVEMLMEIDPPEGMYSTFREREIRKHIGDYTLFMVGIFRENVERRGILEYYLREGKKSYRHVSELDRMFYASGARLFAELSKRFEFLAGALTYMKRVYFRPESHRGRYSDVVQRLIVW